VLEQPAGKNAGPHRLAVRIGPFIDQHLNKSAGFRRIFPWRGFLARRKAQDHIINAPCLARLHFNIARYCVALVHQAQSGHALIHWRADRGATICTNRGNRRGLRGNIFRNCGFFRLWRGRVFAA